MGKGQPYAIYPEVLAIGAVSAIHCFGSYLRILESTGDVLVSFDNNAFQPIEKGLSLPSREPFSVVKLQNISGAINNVKVCISDVEVSDDRNVITGTVNVAQTATVDVSEVIGSTLVTKPVVDVLTTATLVLAADGDTRDTMFQADSGNSISIFVGDSSVTTLTGQEMTAGSVLSIKTSGALYAIASATGAKIRTMIVGS